MEVMMTEKPALKIYQPKPTPHVTQEMMRKYRQLKMQLRAIKASFKELRQFILDARTFEEGSHVHLRKPDGSGVPQRGNGEVPRPDGRDRESGEHRTYGVPGERDQGKRLR